MEMELFTWQMLGSTAGATMAVALLTQITKQILGIRRLPTQLWSYLLALCTLLLAGLFGGEGQMQLADGLLCAFNAALVSLAANGGYVAIKRIADGLQNLPTEN